MRWMFAHRYGRPRAPRTTAGEVFVALSRDAWAREKLGEVYRRLFEVEGVRQGSSPDHFVYVSPGRARQAIDELAGWVGARFGDPGGTVPRRTPFGYLSGRYDGWVTYFAALAFGGDRDLASDFSETVAGVSWSTPGGGVSRASTAGGGGESGGGWSAPQPPPAPRPAPPAPAGFLTAPFAASTSPAPSPPSPAPAAPKPTIIERFFGMKTPTAAPAAPAATAGESGELSPEEEARADALVERLLERRRERAAARARKTVEDLRRFTEASEGAEEVSAATAFPMTYKSIAEADYVKKGKKKTRAVEAADEVERERLAAKIEQEKISAEKRRLAAEEEALAEGAGEVEQVEKRDVRAELRRPPGSSGAFGG